MSIYVPKLGDSLSTIAARELGDWRSWRNIADMNSITPIAPLPVGQQITLPDSTQSIALSALSQIGDTIRSDNTIALSALQQVAIIPGASGYSRIAQQALAEINGVLGTAVSALTPKPTKTKTSDRAYDGNPQLVDWLLPDYSIA